MDSLATMTETVEAASLSSLIEIASDPPIDPQVSVLETWEPLQLYIARVPGSKDVFLTPMKPREKVVTAEDVESSLYYLHIHGPQDERLMNPQGQQHMDENRPSPVPPHDWSSAPPAQTVDIPPWPPAFMTSNTFQSSRYSQPSVRGSGEQRRSPLYPSPPWSPTQANISGCPYPLDASEIGGLRMAINDNRSSRRQTENRHFHSRNRSEDLYEAQPHYGMNKPLPPQPNASSLSSPGIHRPQDQMGDPASPMHPRFFSDEGRSSLPEPRQQAQMDRERSLTPDGNGAVLTLIRRDPATGQQWNVARITEPTIRLGSASESQRDAKKIGLPISIEIENPAYSKFVETRHDSISTSSSRHKNHNQGYSCRMSMEPSQFRELKSKHRKASSENMGHSPSEDSQKDSAFTFSSSMDLHPQHTSEPSMSIVHEKKRPRLKTYAFRSPWNGRCEFSESGLGSTLKCKHSMSPPNLAAEPSTPVNVSELRFNLPGGGPLASPPPFRQNSPQLSPRRAKFFSRKHFRRHSDATANVPAASNEPSPVSSSVDLSLGQELAGGGFSGKQAKLGKLIIEEEGIKMLDLLVAANMSLWWREYGKT